MIICTLTPNSDQTEISHRVYNALHDAKRDDTAAECAAALFYAHDAAAAVAMAIDMVPDLKLEWEAPPCAQS